MINQELVSFVQNSLQKGETKEKIISDLLSNNWTLDDIKECFTSLNIDISSTVDTSPMIKNTQGDSKKTLIISIVVLSLISISALGFYFRDSIPVIKDLVKSDTPKVDELTQDQINKEKLEETQSEIPVATETIQEQSSETKIEETKTLVVGSKVTTTKTTPINCKDEACFLKAIKTCSPAVYQNTQVSNIFGMFNETIKSTATLKGLNSSKKCDYESYVNDVINLEYTPEMKDFMLAELTTEYLAKKRSEPDFPKEYKNLTDEELRKKAVEVPQSGIDSAKSSIGITTKCSFTTTYLTGLYAKWAKGEYSSEDLKPGNCVITNKEGEVMPTSDIIKFSYNNSSTKESSSSNVATNSNLNGKLEIEWGKFVKAKNSIDKDMWLMPIKMTNNENKMVILYINGVGKTGGYRSAEVSLKSGMSEVYDLEIEHYNFDEVSYDKHDIKISAYECSKLSESDAKDICLSGWGQDGKLSPWEVLKSKEDAGTPIKPTIISEKYFNFNSLNIPPAEISKEEYLK